MNVAHKSVSYVNRVVTRVSHPISNDTKMPSTLIFSSTLSFLGIRLPISWQMHTIIANLGR